MPASGKKLRRKVRGKIGIKHRPRKVRAVVIDQIEVERLGREFSRADDASSCSRGGRKPKCENASLKSNAHQLGPAAVHEVALEDAFAKRVRCCFVIAVAQAPHHGAVDRLRNFAEMVSTE